MSKNGITHLIEHMLFKGTSQKSSLEIVKLIEGMGGSFDAYTTKESILIITKFLSEHLSRVFELITEVLLESKIAQEDLAKEKSVVLEEIKSANEDPGDHVFDLFFRSLFPEHPIGLPIAGTGDSLQRIDAPGIKNYYRTLLNKKLIVAVSGDFQYEKILELAKKKFAALTQSKPERTVPPSAQSTITVQKKKEISQVHFVFGTSGVGYSSPHRYPLSILDTAFGGGMSSRLFQGLRDKTGLVYDVNSFVDLYSDCGITGFYFVCDKRNLGKVAKTLQSIFRELHVHGFSKEEVELAKTYLTGNLLLSLENSTNRMLRLAKEMSYLEKVTPISEVIKRIRAIRVDEINDLVKEYLDPKKFSITAIGPVSEKEIENVFSSIMI